MTEQDFINHWSDRIAGMALTGMVHATDEKARGPFAAGQQALLLPEKVRRLLTDMYRSAQNGKPPEPPKAEPPKPPAQLPAAKPQQAPPAQGAKK